jgi:hypothetical protein
MSSPKSASVTIKTSIQTYIYKALDPFLDDGGRRREAGHQLADNLVDQIVM